MSTDPFILTKEQIKELEEVKPKRSARRLLFFQFPAGVFKRLLLRCSHRTIPTCLAVLMVIYETCYKDFQHKTRLQVTTRSLKRYRINRWQKYRALQQLHSAGLLILETEGGKNPWVTVPWLAGAFD